MKRFLLSISAIALAAMASVPAAAQEKKLVGMTGYSLYSNEWGQKEDGTWGYISTKLETPTLNDYYFYYYDSENRLAVETPSHCQYRYTYNADGTAAAREQWNQSGSVFSMTQKATYEYDADKNVVKMVTTNSYGSSATVYEGYEKGEYKVMKNLDAAGNVTYETHYALKFNADNTLAERIQLTQNSETKEYDQPNVGEFYTYTDGKLTQKVTAYYNASAEGEDKWTNVTGTSAYTYNADGSIATRTEVSDSRGMHSEVEWRYTYASLDAKYVPQNVKAEPMEGTVNQVYVTWSPVEGATGYFVLYDNSKAEVAASTEFLTPMLSDGEHQVAVQAVVGGESKNLSGFVPVSVKDNGNLPMENFKITGAKVVTDEWGSSYYALDCAWDVPEGASAITDYKVYVDKQDGTSWYPSAQYTRGLAEADKKDTYNEVATWNTGMNFYWSTFQDQDEDWQPAPSGPTCLLWITAVYASGESAASNKVLLNVYAYTNASDPSAIEDTKADGQDVEIFSLSGARVSNAQAAGKGIYLVKQGDSVKKILK